MSDEWQQNDGAAPAGDDQAWDNGEGRVRSPSPPRNGVDSAAQDAVMADSRGRSRSPGAGNGDRGRQGGGGGGGNNPGNNLHVSSLSSRVDSRELENVFGKFGKVDRANVMYDPHTRESRGFAFVTMELPEDADAAVAALNGTEIMGKAIHVEKARRGRARTPTPGRYFGPPKRSGAGERPYDPRPYDSRYAPRRDERRSYRDPRDDRRGGDRYDDRRYDDRRGGGGGGGDRYDDRRRGGGGYDDRRQDDRRY